MQIPKYLQKVQIVYLCAYVNKATVRLPSGYCYRNILELQQKVHPCEFMSESFKINIKTGVKEIA